MFQTPNRTEPKSTRNRRNRNRTGTEPGLYQILETETEPNRNHHAVGHLAVHWWFSGMFWLDEFDGLMPATCPRWGNGREVGSQLLVFACGRNCCEILQHAELPGAPLWIQDDACQLLYKHRVAGSDFAERHSSWLCAFARDGRRQLVATSLCHVQPRNVFGWFIIATSTATGCSRTWTTNSDRGEGCCISEARRRMSTRVTV